jgi:D-sedoheptulose 7-phosphate isomerase
MEDFEKDIVSFIEENIEVKKKLLNNIEKIDEIVKVIIDTYKKGNKILICGNGGSAADAQHFAAELVGRYKLERKGLPAIALTTDSSNLTAIGNDYGFETVFSRQVEALGNSGDILVSISTSGNSKNCINAINLAKEKGLKTISLLGKSGGLMKEISDISLVVPSDNTPRIQETHILIIHTICELLEKQLFKN